MIPGRLKKVYSSGCSPAPACFAVNALGQTMNSAMPVTRSFPRAGTWAACNFRRRLGQEAAFCPECREHGAAGRDVRLTWSGSSIPTLRPLTFPRPTQGYYYTARSLFRSIFERNRVLTFNDDSIPGERPPPNGHWTCLRRCCTPRPWVLEKAGRGFHLLWGQFQYVREIDFDAFEPA
jgi:hypothetical protein